LDIIEFFDAKAAQWDNNLAPSSAARTAAAFFCGAQKGSRVLDIAGGTGIMFRELLELGAAQLVAVDISPKMVELARKKFAGDPRVTVHCANVLEWAEKDFDVALIYNAYPHFLDKPTLLAHVAQLLKPGGRFTVAHGVGREGINHCHTNVPSAISTALRTAKEEAAAWEPWFQVDALVDTPNFYLISGCSKKLMC